MNMNVKLTERQVKAVLDCLDVFSSEREFSEKRLPAPKAMDDFGIYIKEVIKDADIEAVREVLKNLRELANNVNH